MFYRKQRLHSGGDAIVDSKSTDSHRQSHFRFPICFVIAIVVFSFSLASAQTDSVKAFEQQLSSIAPIKSLRYTEIDCASGRQRQFFAAIDTNGFFLREFTSVENPTEKITLTNIPQSSNFHGRNGDVSWQINGTQITKANKYDRVSNVYNLGSDTSKRDLTTLLNFGIPSIIVRHGTFVWGNLTNINGQLINTFSAQLAPKVKMIRERDGAKLTNVDGYIVIRDGFVSELHAMDGTVHFEYATNAALPLGVPSKILIGKNNSECQTIYLINELLYGHAEKSQHLFSPEAKFLSTNIIASIVFVTNGSRQMIFHGGQRLLPPPISSQPLLPSGKTSLVRSIIVCMMLVFPAFLIFRAIRKNKT